LQLGHIIIIITRQSSSQRYCGTRVTTRSDVDLEDEFNSEDAGEDEVKVVENDVSHRLLVYGILGGQGDTARTDDDHYEQVKVTQVHHEVTETSHPAQMNK